MNTLLDSDLIRARRLELGLSERTVAKHLGVGASQSVLRGLEAGTNHKDLALGDLKRLADVLGLQLHQLLAPPAEKAPVFAGPPTREGWLGLAVAQVGALLYDVDHLIPIEALASSTGYTLEQIDDVIDELETHLRQVGLMVHRLGNSVKIWRTIDAVSRSTLQPTWRQHVARCGLDIGQVFLLHQTYTGRRSKTLTNDQKVTTNQLVNAGILTRTASGGAELTPDVRFSLLLNDDPEVPDDPATHRRRLAAEPRARDFR